MANRDQDQAEDAEAMAALAAFVDEGGSVEEEPEASEVEEAPVETKFHVKLADDQEGPLSVSVPNHERLEVTQDEQTVSAAQARLLADLPQLEVHAAEDH